MSLLLTETYGYAYLLKTVCEDDANISLSQVRDLAIAKGPSCASLYIFR